jgi:hypothetical protein
MLVAQRPILLEGFQNHAFERLGQIRPGRAGRRRCLMQDRG